MLLAVDFYEDLVNKEGVAITSVISFSSPSVFRPDLDTPQPDRLSAGSDAPFSQEIFDIAMDEVESIIEPDSVGNDVWWKPVSLVSIHGPILAS